MALRALIGFALMVAVVSHPIEAQALTITSLIGDKDGFGLGVSAGQSFDSRTLSMRPPGSSAGEFTDVYSDLAMFVTSTHADGALSFIWSHTFDLTDLVSIESVSLEIFSAGYTEGATLFVGDNRISSLSSGGVGVNWTGQLYQFDLTPFLAELRDGSASFSLDIPGALFDPSIRHSNLVLDYSQLTISGTETVAPVPEPSTMVLLGVGMLAVLAVQRRKSKSRRAV